MSKMRRHQGLLILGCLAAALLLTVPALAQNPTGTLFGRVTDDSGAALPGVTVMATSAALQGDRTTVTGGNGDYKLVFLPPGEYTISYTLDGFKTSNRDVRIAAATQTPSNVQLELGTITEEITVSAGQAAISETSTGAANITAEELDDLPISRSLASAINLAPGVQNTGPSSAPSISGSPSYENLWMINGVVVNENVRGSVLPLFIEDAIQETTTSTSGVSAEYGRFTGGVVNAITKSGGNNFDGSLRISFTNESWESETPLTGDQEDTTNDIYEATLGGFFVKDRLGSSALAAIATWLVATRPA